MEGVPIPASPSGGLSGGFIFFLVLLVMGAVGGGVMARHACAHAGHNGRSARAWGARRVWSADRREIAGDVSSPISCSSQPPSACGAALRRGGVQPQPSLARKALHDGLHARRRPPPQRGRLPPSARGPRCRALAREALRAPVAGGTAAATLRGNAGAAGAGQQAPMPLTQNAEAVGGFGSFDSPVSRPGGAPALGGRVSLAREDDGSDMSTSGKAAGSAPGRTARAHPSAMDVRIAASPDLLSGLLTVDACMTACVRRVT